MKQDFHSKMQGLSDDQLLEVIHHANDYHPEALQAAQVELTKRNIPYELISTRRNKVQSEPDSPAHQSAQLAASFKSGANWYYWIAGLSLVNSLLLLLNIDVYFLAGLGISMFAAAVLRAIAQDVSGMTPIAFGVVAFVISLLASGLFVLLGRQANHRMLWAFILGMVLYTLDALILVAVQDWLSVGFHAFALFSIWRGYTALKRLNELEVLQGAPINPSGD